MKNPKIRELTASEPLSLEEEYAMQRTWVVDENSEYNLWVFGLEMEPPWTIILCNYNIIIL